MNELSSTQKGKPKYDIILPDTRPYVRTMSQAEANVMAAFAATQVVDGESAFQSREGADERTSGVDRSYAFLLRLIPLIVLWGILSIVVIAVLTKVVELDSFNARMIGLLAFVFLCFGSYSSADSRERYDSKNGVEHHRIDAAVTLAEKKLDHDAALRKQLVLAYLKQLEGPRHE